MILHLPKQQEQKVSIVSLVAKENFKDEASFSASNLCLLTVLGLQGEEIYRLCAYTLLAQKFLYTINIPAVRLGSKKRLQHWLFPSS